MTATEAVADRFTELANQWLSWLEHNRARSVRTVAVYRLALERLVSFAGDRDPLGLGRDELDLFTGPWLYKQLKIGPRGRHTYVAAVRGFFTWAYRFAKAIERNPAASLEYPDGGRRLPRVITLTNAEKLMWGPDFGTFVGLRDATMLSILAGCGIRVSGLVMLNERDVLREKLDGELRLVIRVLEKGKRERLVPVPKPAAFLLDVYMAHDELKSIDRNLPDGDRVLFVSVGNRTCPPHEYHGERRRLKRGAVNELINRYGRRAGIPDEQLHPHAMRHLFGTEMAESDVQDSRIQLLMGHRDRESTEIYKHLAMRKLTRESDRANPLSKMKTPGAELLKRLAKP